MAEASNEPYRPLTVDIDRWASEANVETAKQLFGMLNVIDGNGALRRALTDPSRAADDRVKLVHKLFGERTHKSDTVEAVAGFVHRLLGNEEHDPAIEIVSELVKQRSANERQLGDGIERTAVMMAAAAAENRGGLQAMESLVDELIQFKNTVDHSEEIQGAFADSRASAEAKAQLASRLMPNASEEGALLTQRAVSEPRGALPGRLIERFADVVAERQQRWIAHIVTSRPLSHEQLEKLRQSLNALYQRDLKLAVEVDRSLIGGLRVQVGEEVIDGSVTHRLGQLQQRIGA